MLPYIKANKSKELSKYTITAFSSFMICFTIQIIMNQFVGISRSLPDELGAMYLASTLAGHDWTYIMTHPAYYYGSLTAPFLYPFFILIKDPLVLYQCLLGVGAFFRSLPALISFYIMAKYFRIKNLPILFFISIGSCFFTPTRATNIDNEPGLILCCWLIIFLLISLQNDAGRTVSKCKSVLLPLILSLSLLAHTRAILYTLAVIAVILLFHFLTGKHLVNYKFFIASYLLFYSSSKFIVNLLTKYLYPIESPYVSIANTSGSLEGQLQYGINNLVSHFGLQSFFDLFNSNLIVIFVFSGGLIIYCVWYTLFHLFYSSKDRLYKKSFLDTKNIFFPCAFCIIGGGAGVLGLCITWLSGAVDQHLYNGNLTRGYFYLRYYANFFSPLLMIIICNWLQSKENIYQSKQHKKFAIFTMFTIIIASIFCWFSFLSTVTYGQAINDSDWFYYFAPLSMTFQAWPNAVQSLSYYLVAIIISLLIFIIILVLIKHKKYHVCIIMLSFFLLYQYCYMVIYWDRPYSLSDNYYGSINAIYNFKKNNPSLFSKIDKVYYKNSIYGPQYLVQYILQDIPVSLEDTKEIDDAIIIVSSFQDILDIGADIDCEYLPLDNNEFILVKGEKYLDLFQKEGIDMLPITTERIFNMEGAKESENNAFYSTAQTKLKRGTYDLTVTFNELDDSNNHIRYEVIEKNYGQTITEGSNSTGPLNIYFSIATENTPIQINFYSDDNCSIPNITGWKYSRFTPGADNLNDLTQLTNLLESDSLAINISCLVDQENDISLSFLERALPNKIIQLQEISNILKNNPDCVIALSTNNSWWSLLDSYVILYSFDNYKVLVPKDSKLSYSVQKDLHLSDGNLASFRLWSIKNEDGYLGNIYSGIPAGKYNAYLETKNVPSGNSLTVEVWANNQQINLETVDSSSIISIPIISNTVLNNLHFYVYDQFNNIINYSLLGISLDEDGISLIYHEYLASLLSSLNDLDSNAYILLNNNPTEISNIKKYLSNVNSKNIKIKTCLFEDDSWIKEFSGIDSIILPNNLELVYTALENGYTIVDRSSMYVLLYKGTLPVAHPYSNNLTIYNDFFTIPTSSGIVEQKISLPEGIYDINVSVDYGISNLDSNKLGIINVYDKNEIIKKIPLLNSSKKMISTSISKLTGISDLRVGFFSPESSIINGKIVSITKVSDGFLVDINSMQTTDPFTKPDDGEINIFSEKGETVYGPYITLPAGQYDIIFQFETSSTELISFDVTALNGDSILATADSSNSTVLTDTLKEVSLKFDILTETENIEFRCHIPPNHHFTLKDIKVIPQGDSALQKQ